jgi:hypothetical protein
LLQPRTMAQTAFSGAIPGTFIRGRGSIASCAREKLAWEACLGDQSEKASRRAYVVRFSPAGSSDRCNTSTESFGWGFEAQSLAWPFIELPSHSVQLRLRVHRQVGSLEKILPQQAVGVLIGSTLPRTLRIAEVDVDVGRHRNPPMIGKLLAPVAGRRSKLCDRQSLSLLSHSTCLCASAPRGCASKTTSTCWKACARRVGKADNPTCSTRLPAAGLGGFEVSWFPAHGPDAGPLLAQIRRTQREHNESGYPLIADIGADIAERQRSAISGLMHRSKQHLYSITSSARASSEAGTVRPSALAVLRLITSSYLVGACTGKSAGFSPLRMRST